MSIYIQDAAVNIGKWNPVLQTDKGELQLFINGKLVKPTDDELAAIEAKAIELEDDANKNAYKSLRAEEYAKLNQFELMFDDKENGTNNWKIEVDKIKLKHPKGLKYVKCY
jgi:hypothetical protein